MATPILLVVVSALSIVVILKMRGKVKLAFVISRLGERANGGIVWKIGVLFHIKQPLLR
jgi:hypothetical protein